MAYPVFVPYPNPDEKMPVTPEQSILESDFGEYVQRARLGINTIKNNIDPKWTNLYRNEANAILSFLRERGRDRPFYYTAPEEPQRLYVCDKLTYQWHSGRRCDISASFVETRLP